MTDIVLAFGLIAVVLTVTGLISRVVDRSPLSMPLLFLMLGLLLGEPVLGVIDIGPDARVLEVVATLTLSLVLFLDAVKLRVDEVGRGWVAPFLVLGPGTALIIGLGALPLALILGFGWVVAFIGGAILASTDPVVLRDIVRDPRIPRSIRQVLKIEAGMNDIVVLPVILILIAIARKELGGAGDWTQFAVELLLVGPAIGLAIGGVGSWLMARADARLGVRREYQALYGIGMVLGAYAAATAAGGDGFLAAFAAGLGVVLLNQNLCDCFLEYGEITSEMAMLFAFVLFGAALSSILGEANVGLSLALAALVIFGIRPTVLGAVLSRATMSWQARAFISWFGPRGLNSLLLALLVVHAGIAGSEVLLATVGIVVLASIAIHGASAGPIAKRYEQKVAEEVLDEERESTAAGLFTPHDTGVPIVTPERLDALLREPEPPIVLDVRSRASYVADDAQIPGSVRVPADLVAEWALTQSKERKIVAYCT